MGNNQSQLNKSVDTAYISIDDEYNKNDDPEIRNQIKKIKSYQQKPPKKVVKKSKNPFNMLCCQQPKESQPWLEHFQEQCQQQSSEWTQAMIQMDFKRMNVYSDSYFQKNLQLLFYQNSDYNENSSISKYKVSIPKAGNYQQLNAKNIQKKSTITNQSETEQQRQQIKQLIKQSYIFDENFIGPDDVGQASEFFNELDKSTSSMNVPSFIFQQKQVNQKENNQKYIKQLELYQMMIEQIKQDMLNKHSYFQKIILQFKITYCEQYNMIFNQIQTNQKLDKAAKDLINQAVIDLQQFIRIIQESVILFYNLNNPVLKRDVPLFSRENIINFITSFVFDQKDIYSTIFNLLNLLNQDTEKKLAQTMNQGLILTQQDLYITKKYQLNKYTYDYLKNKNQLSKNDSLVQKDLEEKINQDENLSINRNALKQTYLEKVNTDNAELQRQQSIKNKFDKQKQMMLNLRFKKSQKIDQGQSINIDPSTLHSDDELTNSYCSNNVSDLRVSKTYTDKINEQNINEENTCLQKIASLEESTNINKNNIQDSPQKNSVVNLSNKTSSDQRIQNLQKLEYIEMCKKENDIIYIKQNLYGNYQVEKCGILEYNEEKIEETNQNLQQIKKLPQELKKQVIYEIIKSDPYFECIKYLMKINYKNSPLSKLRMILRASENIMKIITDYYNFFGAKFNNIVDADDLLSIYNYITLKSNVPNLATHCILIEKFSTNSTLNSLSGFYLTTIQASIDFLIADINEEFIQKNIQSKKDQYFSCLNELNNVNEQQSKKQDELLSQNKKKKNSSQKNEYENGIPAVQEYDDNQ